jgi:energy-coupling factor transporter ATP-binding protein EcfA2
MIPPPIKVRIKNFQSIEDLSFEIRGFTCITGKTNIGKSAIMRAINGALKNNPVTGLVRTGDKFCTVDIETDKWGFKWEKGGGVNRYWISGEEKPLDKVGQGQLSRIADMGFKSIEVGDDEQCPWFAGQFDPLFLLNKSGPAITKFISDVSRLQVLQDAISISLKGKTQNLNDAKLRNDDILKLKLDEKKLDNLDMLIRVNDDLRKQEQSINDYEKRISCEQFLLNKIDQVNRAINVFEGISRVSIPKDNLGEIVNRLVSMNRLFTSLECAAHRIIPLRAVQKLTIQNVPDGIDQLIKAKKYTVIYDLQDSVEKLSNIEKVPVLGQINEEEVKNLRSAISLETQIRKSSAVVAKLSTSINIGDVIDPDQLMKAIRISREMETVSTTIEKLTKTSRLNESELAKIMEELKDIPVCSMCGRPVEDCIHPPVNTTQDRICL